MKFGLNFAKLKKIFHFDSSSDYFILCDFLLEISGLGIRKFRKCIGTISVLIMVFYWYFILVDFYNHLNPFNLDLIMSGLGGSLILMMGIFKFSVIVSSFVFASIKH